MTTKPTAVFRFDASAAIGGGHAVRPGALAAALAREGWRTLCAVRPRRIRRRPLGHCERPVRVKTPARSTTRSMPACESGSQAF